MFRRLLLVRYCLAKDLKSMDLELGPFIWWAFQSKFNRLQILFEHTHL